MCACVFVCVSCVCVCVCGSGGGGGGGVTVVEHGKVDHSLNTLLKYFLDDISKQSFLKLVLLT